MPSLVFHTWRLFADSDDNADSNNSADSDDAFFGARTNDTWTK